MENEGFIEQLLREVAAVEAIKNPAERALRAGELLATNGTLTVTLAAIRKQAVREMADSGLSLSQIGDQLGLSKSTVQGLLR